MKKLGALQDSRMLKLAQGDARKTAIVQELLRRKVAFIEGIANQAWRESKVEMQKDAKVHIIRKVAEQLPVSILTSAKTAEQHVVSLVANLLLRQVAPMERKAASLNKSYFYPTSSKRASLEDEAVSEVLVPMLQERVDMSKTNNSETALELVEKAATSEIKEVEVKVAADSAAKMEELSHSIENAVTPDVISDAVLTKLATQTILNNHKSSELLLASVGGKVATAADVDAGDPGMVKDVVKDVNKGADAVVESILDTGAEADALAEARLEELVNGNLAGVQEEAIKSTNPIKSEGTPVANGGIKSATQSINADLKSLLKLSR